MKTIFKFSILFFLLAVAITAVSAQNTAQNKNQMTKQKSAVTKYKVTFIELGVGTLHPLSENAAGNEIGGRKICRAG